MSYWKVTHPTGEIELSSTDPLWAKFDPMLVVEEITMPKPDDQVEPDIEPADDTAP